jgi:hypothetical protein
VKRLILCGYDTHKKIPDDELKKGRCTAKGGQVPVRYPRQPGERGMRKNTSRRPSVANGKIATRKTVIRITQDPILPYDPEKRRGD